MVVPLLLIPKLLLLLHTLLPQLSPTFLHPHFFTHLPYFLPTTPPQLFFKLSPLLLRTLYCSLTSSLTSPLTLFVTLTFAHDFAFVPDNATTPSPTLAPTLLHTYVSKRHFLKPLLRLSLLSLPHSCSGFHPKPCSRTYIFSRSLRYRCSRSRRNSCPLS